MTWKYKKQGTYINHLPYSLFPRHFWFLSIHTGTTYHIHISNTTKVKTTLVLDVFSTMFKNRPDTMISHYTQSINILYFSPQESLMLISIIGLAIATHLFRPQDYSRWPFGLYYLTHLKYSSFPQIRIFHIHNTKMSESNEYKKNKKFAPY